MTTINSMTEQNPIAKICDNIKEFLLEKNKRYGNSALEPVRVFSKAQSDEAIRVRIDDKLSRITNSNELRKNDIIDLIGYLVLLCVNKNWLNIKDLID